MLLKVPFGPRITRPNDGFKGEVPGGAEGPFPPPVLSPHNQPHGLAHGFEP